VFENGWYAFNILILLDMVRRKLALERGLTRPKTKLTLAKLATVDQKKAAQKPERAERPIISTGSTLAKGAEHRHERRKNGF
jgi:hypothetical protein